MNRRGFLRGVGALAVAAPVAPAALGAAMDVGQGAGSVLGGEWMCGVTAGSAVMTDVVACVSMEATGLAALAYAANEAVRRGEWRRRQWYEVYRSHRVSVRRGKTQREPARLVWLRHELKLKRREEANRARYGVDVGPGPSNSQFGARSKRFAWRRINGREKAAMRRMGFNKMPWEII